MTHQAGWLVVARQEIRDLWVSGRGSMLLFLFACLLSAITYLAASNLALNFLERREAVNLLVQFAMAVGVLVTLVVSADGISGERERETLETLLVTPLSRRAILLGKLAAALSLWFGAFVVSAPYIWVLARGLGIRTQALALDLVVGTLVAVGLASIGLLISTASNSNKASLAASVFLLVILFAPTQLPSELPQSWFYDIVLGIDPVTSGLGYVSGQLVEGHSWTEDLSALVSPLLTTVLAGGALILAGPRLVRLTAGCKPDEEGSDSRRCPGLCSERDARYRDGCALDR
jgi:ABC-2 type transport system permease protein